MIASPFHRRRTERFAQLIDEASGGRRHHVKANVDTDLAEFVSVSRRLTDLPVKVESQPEFRDGLRAMLLATIERDGIGATAVDAETTTPRWAGVRLRAGGGLRRPAGSRPPMARRTKARGAIVVGLAAGTLALSGMSAASGSANPGDPLYTVKRSTERAQLALAGSDISKGQLFLEFARTRMDEAEAVRDDPNGLSGVLNDMDAETQEGVKLLTTTAVDKKSPAALDAVDTFANTQRGEATKLRDGVTGTAQSRAGNSVTLLDEILRRSKALRASLKCANPGMAAPDAIGPLPTGSCKAAGANPTPRGTTGNNRTTTGGVGNTDNGQAPTGSGVATTPTESAPAAQTGTGTGSGHAHTGPTASPTQTNGGLLGGLHGLLGG